MSKCNISITTEQQTFHPGDEIRGEVVLQVHEAFTCNGLSVSTQWRTSGKGTTDSGQAETRQIFKGECQPGEQRYPFALAAPRGPFTHRGKLINLDWFVVATADVPWAIDPRAEAPIALTAHSDMSATDPYFFGPQYETMQLAKDAAALPSATGVAVTSKSQAWFWLIVAPLLVGLAIATVMWGPIILAMASPFIIFFAVKHWMIKSKIGKPEVTTSKRVVCRGDRIAVAVQFGAKKKVTFGQIYVELESQEQATHGSGKSRHTHREIVHQSRTPLLLGGNDGATGQTQAQGGEYYSLQAMVPIADEVPCTLAENNNRITTTLKVHIELIGWPDWQEEIPLTVRPGRT